MSQYKNLEVAGYVIDYFYEKEAGGVERMFSFIKSERMKDRILGRLDGNPKATEVEVMGLVRHDEVVAETYKLNRRIEQLELLCDIDED